MNEQEEHQAKLAAVLKNDDRYPIQAYLFMEEAVQAAMKDYEKRSQVRGSRHVTGQELVHSIVKELLRKYGPMAWDVLTAWNIHKTEDFGNLVYNLVRVKLLGVSPEDSPNDFVDVLNLEEELTRPFVSHKPLPTIPRIV